MAQTAFKHLQDQLKWVDLVFEVADARLPVSSRHPDTDRLFSNKPRVVVLAKEDLADPKLVKYFLEELTDANKQAAVACSLKESKGKSKLIDLALALTEEKRLAQKKKGLLPRPMRACVVGMPNVGKSSLINWLIGTKRAKVGDQPGVTKGTQWIRLHPQLELMDTPGILPHTSLAKNTTFKLSLLNLFPEAQYDLEDIAEQGLTLIQERYPDALYTYEKSAKSTEDTPGGVFTLAHLARLRNCLAAGGKLDERRAATIFLNDLRTGKLGRITLDARQE